MVDAGKAQCPDGTGDGVEVDVEKERKEEKEQKFSAAERTPTPVVTTGELKPPEPVLQRGI